MGNCTRFSLDKAPADATPGRVWLECFPATRRSGVANLFHQSVRGGAHTPALVVHQVQHALQRRRQWTADPVRNAHLVAILTAIDTDRPGAVAYAATVIAYEQLPQEERQQLKHTRATQYREAYMQSQPTTDAQLRYLRTLGYTGTTPANRLEASTLIDGLLRAARKGQS